MSIKVLCNNKDISRYIQSVSWSGSKTEAARKIELTLLDQVAINLGDSIAFFEDGEELFRGYMLTKDKTASQKTLSNTAYDSLIYLTKSTGTYNFKKMTPERITIKVCSDFNIPAGLLTSTNINCNLIFKEKSIYNIIMTAYTKAENKTGYKYIPVMKKGRINVIVKGAAVISYNSNYVTDTQNSESIENMINRIKAYNDKGKYIGMIENTSWIKQFGVIQSAQSTDQKTAYGLKNILHGVDKTVSMNGIGDSRCITGNAIKIKVADGISGLFFIDEDSHTWQDGIHTMQLTLNFQNMMDEQSDNDTEDTMNATTKKGSNKKAKRSSKLSAKKAAKAAAKAKEEAAAKKAAEAAIKEYGG